MMSDNEVHNVCKGEDTESVDFHSWWVDFNAHVNQKEVYSQFFIQNALKLDLANVTSMISVGPGKYLSSFKFYYTTSSILVLPNILICHNCFKLL